MASNLYPVSRMQPMMQQFPNPHFNLYSQQPIYSSLYAYIPQTLQGIPDTPWDEEYEPWDSSQIRLEEAQDNELEIPNFDLREYSYEYLQQITKDFSEATKVGEGGFASVYKAKIKWFKTVAVKKWKRPFDDTSFDTELDAFKKLQHENLLSLVGYSVDGPHKCLVMEYMPNGSLQDRLECKGDKPPIPWRTRLKIAYGAAKGISHLHTFSENPVVHRDIKSANILLDKNFNPKISDFGFIREGARGNSPHSLVMTMNPVGTILYMPDEAMKGEVSVLMDSYGLGMVLLELLTAFSPLMVYFAIRTEKKDLREFFERNVDTSAGWDPNAASDLLDIALQFLATSKSERIRISHAVSDLEELVETYA